MSAPSCPPLPAPLVEEGDGWLTMAKPSGLPCLPPHADPDGDCLLRRLLAVRPAQGQAQWPQGFAGGIAHRLDVATSGMVLVAASPDALAWLRGLFTGRQLRKRYCFLTRKQVAWDKHRVDRPLAHDRRRRSRMVVQRGQNTPHRGKWLPASTTFSRLGRVEGEGEDGPYHLWQALIESGVMHQIRVHAGFAGLALAGDRLYGGGEPTPWARAHAPEQPPFHLHHVGLSGPGLAPRPLDRPGWWPEVLPA